MTTTILKGDCRDILKTLPDQSVHCCVTSPPYFGLRDYGHAGQIGLEATPDAFVAEMVAVFREVKRVLRDDGTLFLNLGDSYMSSGSRQTGRNDTTRETPGGKGGSFRGGVRRAIPCDTSGKELEGSPTNDCLCGNLCGACRAAYRLGKSHSDGQRDSKPAVSSSASSREHKGSPSDRLPTLGLILPDDHSEVATRGSGHSPRREAAQPLASQASTHRQSSPQHPAERRQSGQPSECQLCGCSLPDSVLASARMVDCTCDTTGDGLADRKIGKDVSVSAYLDCTTASLKPKDLIGIPWRVAFALQADGWYLRQDIIWSKPNPMPESVTDRCTKAHEYIFLMSKSARYHYDADAIKEAALYAGDNRGARTDNRRGTECNSISGKTGTTRNKRSVWEIATQPFSGWHETVRRVPVASDAPDDGKKRITSQDCPLHGDRLDLVSNVPCGERGDVRQTRNGSNETHPAQGQIGGFVPIATNHEEVSAYDSSDLLPHEYEGFANPHSNECCKTAPVLETCRTDTALAETADCIGDSSAKFGLIAINPDIQLNRTARVDLSDGQKTQTLPDTFHIHEKSGSSSASHDLHCTCEHYIEITESSTHFATFPPDLIEPCIKAGCPEFTCGACGTALDSPHEKTGSRTNGKTVQDMQVVRQQGGAGPQEQDSQLLQQGVLLAVGGEESIDHKGMDNNVEGLSCDSYAGPSECGELRVCLGTSVGDGSDIGPVAASDRDCSPQGRKQTKQRPGKFGSADQDRTRQITEEAHRDDPLSSLCAENNHIALCPSCGASLDEVGTRPGVVLDCFGGAGTTGLVADRLQRHATLIELNSEYADMARRRIIGDAPLFADAAE